MIYHLKKPMLFARLIDKPSGVRNGNGVAGEEGAHVDGRDVEFRWWIRAGPFVVWPYELSRDVMFMSKNRGVERDHRGVWLINLGFVRHWYVEDRSGLERSEVEFFFFVLVPVYVFCSVQGLKRLYFIYRSKM